MDSLMQLDEQATASPVTSGPTDYAASTYTRSTSIAQLAMALAKAQGEIAGAIKDKTNPHFKSSYADLASGWEACRPALSKHGLSVLQPVSAEGARVTLTTILMHSSGEWISTDLTMAAQQNTPQGIGSCITYARRYAFFALVGIAPEDDDGNAASQGNRFRDAVDREPESSPHVELPADTNGFGAWAEELEKTAVEGVSALMSAFNASKPEYKSKMASQHKARWQGMREKAAAVRKAS